MGKGLLLWIVAIRNKAEGAFCRKVLKTIVKETESSS